MNEEPVTNALARQFLLGEVSDEERERIERLFLAEAETRNRILIAEEDLIEDYLENSLTASDRESFQTQYGQTPGQRRKLRIARSIKDYAAKGAAVPQPSPAISRWRSVLSTLGPGNLKVFIPVAATLSVALVIAVIGLLELNKRGEQENIRRMGIEREIAELNKPSNSLANPNEVLAMVLAPVSVRSARPGSEVTPRADTKVIELELLWIQNERYPSYRALLKRVDGPEQFTISDLRLESKNGGSIIRLKIPARILARGAYTVRLSAVTADDRPPGPAEEYSFTVSG